MILKSRHFFVGVLLGAALFSGCSGGSSSAGGNGSANAGRFIAFVSNRDGNPEIYRMNSDGSSQTRLTNNVAIDLNPSINRAGTEIVFCSARDGNYEIYRLTLATNQLQRLTTDISGVSDTDPVFSPDGSKIAWISRRGGGGNIWVMDANGANQTQITTGGANNVSWSGANQVGFWVSASIPGEILYRQSIGSATASLEGRLDSAIGSISFSPNGETVFYTSQQVDGVLISALVNRNVSTRAETFLIPNAAPIDLQPAWSPDGQNAAFVNRPVTGTAGGNPPAPIRGVEQIFRVSLAGSAAPTQLTTLGTNTEPSWSE